jgi:hypothetical protein
MTEQKSLTKNEKPFIISCGVMEKEIKGLIGRGELDADVVFLNKYLHIDYEKLRQALQASLLKHRDKNPVVIYGDICLGFNGEMNKLVEECGATKVDALNCLDCMLGGSGRLLEIDPDHIYLFLTPAFIKWFEDMNRGTIEETRKMFSMLKGIILVDSMGDLNAYKDRIDQISEQTGLPVLEHKTTGLNGLKSVILKALEERPS